MEPVSAAQSNAGMGLNVFYAHHFVFLGAMIPGTAIHKHFNALSVQDYALTVSR